MRGWEIAGFAAAVIGLPLLWWAVAAGLLVWLVLICGVVTAVIALIAMVMFLALAGHALIE